MNADTFIEVADDCPAVLGRSTEEENGLSEQTQVPQLDGASRSSRSCWPACAATGRSREVCREHEISETLYYSWRDKLFEGGRERWPARRSAAASGSCAGRSRELERALGRKTYELEIAGEALRGWE